MLACADRDQGLHRGFKLVSGELLADGRLGARCVAELPPHHLNRETERAGDQKEKETEGGVTRRFCCRDSGVGCGGWYGVCEEKKGAIVAACHLCDCGLDRREGLECTLIREGTSRLCRSHSPRWSRGFNKRLLLLNLP